jgi:hypothetical protein
MVSKPIKIDEKAPSGIGSTVTEIFSMSDFPAPVGGVITLTSGKYVIKKSVSTSDRFDIGAGAAVTMEIEDSRYQNLTYTGTGTLFTVNGAQSFTLLLTNFICTGAGSQFLDMQNTGVFSWQSGGLIMSGASATIGTISDTTTTAIRDILMFSYTNGIEIERPTNLILDEIIFQGAGSSSDAIVKIMGCLVSLARLSSNVIFTDSGESAFYIDPVICNSVAIDGTGLVGAGDFFQPGTTGAITSFADNSTSATAATVSDSGGQALFTSTAHGLVVGEGVDHTTFTEASYNGSFVVTAVTANTYEVGLDFVSTDSGLFATTTTQVNSTAHGLANGQTLSVFDTINFGNGGYTIFNAQTNSFEITLGKAFPSTETGTWDTGSLTEKSKYVHAADNGAQKDSVLRGSAVVGGNTTATTISVANTYYDLNLNSLMVEGSDIELWTLTNSTTGEMRYDGLNRVNVEYGGLICASSAGASNVFSFRLLKNGVTLSSPDNVDIQTDLTAEVFSMPLSWSVTIDPGDKLRLNVANTEGISNVVIEIYKIRIT